MILIPVLAGRKPDMSAFLFSFFLIYGACNFYVFMKAKAALHPGTGVSLVMAGFILAMVACPFIVRMSEKSRARRPCHSRGLFWLCLARAGISVRLGFVSPSIYIVFCCMQAECC